MRLFGRLSSVTALALSVMLSQPTASKADYQKSDWEMGAIKCAALYTIATAAYPDNESRKQELFRQINFHKGLFTKFHRQRPVPNKRLAMRDIRITNGHVVKDVSSIMGNLSEQYDTDPHSLASLLRGCRSLQTRVNAVSPSAHFDVWKATLDGVKPPKYDASDFRKSKRIVDRWFKAWTKMGRPTPQSMREDFKRKLRGN